MPDVTVLLSSCAALPELPPAAASCAVRALCRARRLEEASAVLDRARARQAARGAPRAALSACAILLLEACGKGGRYDATARRVVPVHARDAAAEVTEAAEAALAARLFEELREDGRAGALSSAWAGRYQACRSDCEIKSL